MIYLDDLYDIIRRAKEWDLYKTKDGLYNISILMTDNPKDWNIFRGYKDIEDALSAGLDYLDGKKE